MITPTIGKPIDRVDGHLKVTGAARYAADAPVQNPLHAVLVQSTIGNGTITTIDSTEAERSPGVRLVITPLNMLKLPEPKNVMFGEKRLPLSDMKIHYAGQYVAVVVADTLERAMDAAHRIKFTYDTKKPVIELHDPAGEIEKPPKDFAGVLQYNRGDVDAAVNNGDHTSIKATYTIPVETHNPMEMSATVAAWDGDSRVTVWDATQYIDGVRNTVAATFKLDPQNVRVICPYTGGGFGCKGAQWPHIILAVAAAKITGQPIKLMLTRQQMFTGVGHRPDLEQTLQLSAAKDGALMAIRHDTLMQGSEVGDHIEAAGTASSMMMYDTPNLAVTHTVHRMNVATPTFMRAPGENPGMFALETAMDELAAALKMDPLALRLKNYAEKHPTNGLPWSGKNLKQCYQLGADLFGWAKRHPANGSMKTADGRPMGWGMATATYPAHRFPGTARIRIYADKDGVRAVGAAASQDLGTGTWTIGTQMTAELTGLPLDHVKFELGDSVLPVSGVSGGSATAGGLAQALAESTDALKLALFKIAGGEDTNADALSLENGKLLATVNGKLTAYPLGDLVRKTGRAFVEGTSIAAAHHGQPGTVPPPSSKPAKAGGGGEDFNANEHKFAFQSFGAHFVEVIVEPMPRITVNRVVTVMDIGRVLNAKTARSQVLGGVVMGIGQALLEETIYDARSARPVTDNLADYAVCVNADIHSIETRFIDIPDTHFNAMGCRGVGEIGITGIAAAVGNAYFHATGHRLRDLPFTIDKLLVT
ncbi:MAG: xanthine dehydrogenase family protein molybdopterin-binding subunit [Phycisphaerae bacterium]|nr:xanthine dehydrogenase family protein molybdopterin-binding subunit [Phycisphaerae bacterium]